MSSIIPPHEDLRRPFCQSVLKYIMDRSSVNFRILQLEEWYMASWAPEGSTDFFPLDFLYAFHSTTPSEKLPIRDGNAQNFQEGISSLCDLAYRFTPEARMKYLEVFLSFATVSGTLCGWLGAYDDVSFENICTVLNRLALNTWGTNCMDSQKSPMFDRKSMYKGWRIATEVMKLHVEELSQVVQSEKRIELAAVMSCIEHWCHFFFQELLIWFFVQTKPRTQFCPIVAPLFPLDASKITYLTNSYLPLLRFLLKKDVSCIFDPYCIETGFKCGLTLADVCNYPTYRMVLLDGSEIPATDLTIMWGRRNCNRRHPLESENNALTNLDRFRRSVLDVFNSIPTIANNISINRNMQQEMQTPMGRGVSRLIDEPAPKWNPMQSNERPKKIPRHSRFTNAPEIFGADPYNANTVKKLCPMGDLLYDAPSWSGLNAEFNAANPNDPANPNHPEHLKYLDDLRRSARGPTPLPGGERKCVQYKRNLTALRNLLLGKDPSDERFELDYPDSDNEDMISYEHMSERLKNAERVTGKARFEASDGALDVDIELLYSEICSWHVDPVHKVEFAEMLYDKNLQFIAELLEKNGHLVESHSTLCSCPKRYSDHWKVIQYLEIYYVVKDALFRLFPELMQSTQAYRYALEQQKQRGDFVQVEVRNFEPSALLFNFKCRSVDPSLTVRLADQMAGASVCLGYFSRTEETGRVVTSPVFLFIVRSVHFEKQDVDQIGYNESQNSRPLSLLHLRICAYKYQFDCWKPKKHQRLHLKHLTGLTNHHRMFRAVHNVCRLTERIQRYFMGAGIPQTPGEMPPYSNQCRLRVDYWSNSDDLSRGVDEGCLLYLGSNSSKMKCNISQNISILTTLREMGSLEPRSSSISLIQGPPGTGKTTTIVQIIATLIHHSRHGHLSSHQTTEIRDGKKFLQRRSDGKGFTILVTAASNQAVDCIARKLLKGVWVEDGMAVVPEMLRVGRHKYPYRDLQPYSVKERALYLQKKDNPDHAEEEKPTSRYVKLAASMAIVLFATNSAVGSASFRNLHVKPDVLIIDEAANATEPETCIPIAQMAESDMLHVVIVGDHMQLPPVVQAKQAMIEYKRFLREQRAKLPFPYEQQIMSLFERMMERYRCPATMLRSQYRSHPGIGLIQSEPFYNGLVSHPQQLEPYLELYNQPQHSKNAFAPFTIVDTSTCRNRFENVERSRVGSYTNSLEAEQVDMVLKRILRAQKEKKDDGSLTGKIAILAPYRSQVAFLSSFLEQPSRFLANPTFRKRIDVLIATVDALQGSERDIVLVSFTRSNTVEKIGFLEDKRRMNVATSRARKLLVLVADSLTLRRHESFRFFFEACLKKNDDSEVIFVEPQNGQRNKSRTNEVQDMRKGGHKRYDLRPRR